MNLALPLLLSGSGVAIAAVAFYNRERPDWQASMPVLIALAVVQVTLGVISWVVLSD